MLGRTPGHVHAIRPLHDGVISDPDVAERMLRYFIDQVRPSRLIRLRMVVCVPSQVTGVERRALEDAATRAGARRVYVIEEPMAAAIGADLPVNDTVASMVVDIGGAPRTSRSSASAASSAPDRYAWVATRSTRRSSATSRASTPCCWVSEAPRTSRSAPARRSPCERSSASGSQDATSRPGCPTRSPSPRQKCAARSRLRCCRSSSWSGPLDVCPPELSGDILDRGIVLTGGGALLRGLDERMRHELGVPVRVADDPLRSVVRGSGRCVEEFSSLERVLVGTQRY